MDGKEIKKNEMIEDVDKAMEEALKENSTWKCDSAVRPVGIADNSIPILITGEKQ